MERQQRLGFHLVFLLIGIILISSVHAFTPTRSSKWTRNEGISRKSQLSPLQLAKSGGKMILTEEMYSENVLSNDVSRPVLVFFSAPW